MAFEARLTDYGMKNNTWWYSSGNLLYKAGYGMPNCTCYAYGRYAEIRNAFANLPTSNAGKWFEQATSFERGQTPRLGAVMVWKDKTNPTKYAGHVAIVEGFASDGGIICSNSAWKGTYFWTATVYKSNDYRMSWMTTNGRNYGFQGFIYNDTADTKPDSEDITEPELSDIPSGSWHAKTTNGYEKESDEAWDNACAIYWQLRNATSIELPSGWTLNAICALLGNIDAESNYNPWQWEGNKILSTSSNDRYNAKGPGYGLCQWTPASTYLENEVARAHADFAPNFSNLLGNARDGAAQIHCLNATTGVPKTQQWYSTSAFCNRFTGGSKFIGMSWTDFRSSYMNVEDLAMGFAICYERPGYAEGTKYPLLYKRRQTAARFWYNKFVNYKSSYTPKDPEKPISDDNPVVEPVEEPENPGPTSPDDIDVNDDEYKDPFIIRASKDFLMIKRRNKRIEV